MSIPDPCPRLLIDGAEVDLANVWIHHQDDPYPGGHRYCLWLPGPLAGDWLTDPRDRLFWLASQLSIWRMKHGSQAAEPWLFVLNTIDAVISVGQGVEIRGDCSPFVRFPFPKAYALIPAAGHSTRMGRPKLSLPLGSGTVLDHVLAALREAGVEHTLVVIAPHVAQLGEIATAAGAGVLQLAAETPDMRATVEHGLRRLEEQFHPLPGDGWLLVPADHPTLHAEVVRRLSESRQLHPQRSIFVPVFEGRRGHPTLFAWEHAAGIFAHPAGEGLNTYVRARAAQVLEVPVSDPDILCDLDTPEDYERLRQRLG
jgi:molybdenum cofactor cytidylyltransferase